MELNLLFKLGSSIALLGWILLLLSPWFFRYGLMINRCLIVIVLAIAYSALVLVHWGQLQGGFDTLDNVILLFSQPEAVVAGWLHYLAFDLFVGCWIVQQSKQEQVPFLLIIPCLLLTFMFGPAGYLLFTIVRIGKGSFRLFDTAENL
jgi:hypothetical protein